MYSMMTIDKWFEEYQHHEKIAEKATNITNLSEDDKDNLNYIVDTITINVSRQLQWQDNKKLTKEQLKNAVFVAYVHALNNKISSDNALIWAELIGNSIARHGTMSDVAKVWISEVVVIMKKNIEINSAIQEHDENLTRTKRFLELKTQKEARDKAAEIIREKHQSKAGQVPP
jgi:hypothetical protein